MFNRKAIWGLVLTAVVFCGIRTGNACTPPPVAALTASPDFTKVGVTVTFDGNSSYATGKTIVKYEWDFDGDGTYDYNEVSPCDGIATYSYTSGGSFTAKLRVTDNRNLTGVDTCVIRVLSSYIPFGMEVNSVSDSNGVITVITTGARYVLSQNGMEMWRRIDPKINDVNERKVATLDFGSSIGALSIEAWDSNEAIVDSNKATFMFESDSLFFVKAKESFTYDHNNLIIPAPWNAPIDANYRHLDRMWTDGYGGSLHAKVSGTPTDSSVTTDKTTISMSADDVMAHMVFPPKLFNFDKLYGLTARPFVHFADTREIINSFIDDPNTMVPYEANGFGAFESMTLYYNPDTNSTSWKDHIPIWLESEGVMGYDVNDAYVPAFIAAAHDKDFKVLGYVTYPSGTRWNYPNGQHQDVSVTLRMLKKLQDDYGIDGWYLDNGNAGDFMADYDFIRQLRTDIGDANVIYHHESVDVWGREAVGISNCYERIGLKAVFYDAYVNYTLNGEVGMLSEVDEPNDKYFRYYSSGYGMSQAYGSHIRNSERKHAISDQEKKRVMGQNLNGTDYTTSPSYSWSELMLSQWEKYFKPAYEKRKAEYLNDANIPFAPDVNWPIGGQTGWFRIPTDRNIIDVNSNSATITWVTDSNSNSEVAYTSNGVWWECYVPGLPDGPDGTESDPNMRTEHTIMLTGLDANTPYEFRIRSTNDTNNPPDVNSQIIWGYVGSFTTDP